MQTRLLGLGGLKVTSLGLGCMGMSEYYGNSDEQESLATIHRALELGLSLLDTADSYGPFTNEELVGRAIRGHRDKVVLATKFGNMRTADGTFLGVNGRPEYVRSACESSLQRLRVQTIDLYYQHRVDPKVPIEETVGAMARLVEEGKVRYLGLSEAAATTIRRAHSIHPIAALQTEYSLLSRDPEDDLLNLCRELSIGFVAYSPLGRGLLTGRIQDVESLPSNDYRRRAPRFQGKNFDQNLEIVEGIKKLANEKGCTAAQLSLAWLLAQADFVVPIPGTKRRHYLHENVGALEVQLSPADLCLINKVAPKGAAAGPRYPEPAMSAVDR